jgi:hypothetical protein
MAGEEGLEPPTPGFGGSWLTLDAEIRAHDADLEALTASCAPAMLDYVKKRKADGKGKMEIIRCLKRFVAREIFGYLCGATEVVLRGIIRSR